MRTIQEGSQGRRRHHYGQLYVRLRDRHDHNGLQFHEGINQRPIVSRVITVNMSTEEAPNKIKRVWTELGKGPRRALIVGWPVCIMVSTYIADQIRNSSSYGPSTYGERGFIWSLLAYWPLVLIGLWIYRGFKADK